LAQLSPLVPVGLSGSRIGTVLQLYHDGDRLLRGARLGVGEEVRYAGHGAQPGDETGGRDSLQVRQAEGAAGRGYTAGRHLRGAFLAGGARQVHAG